MMMSPWIFSPTSVSSVESSGNRESISSEEAEDKSGDTSFYSTVSEGVELADSSKEQWEVAFGLDVPSPLGCTSNNQNPTGQELAKAPPDHSCTLPSSSPEPAYHQAHLLEADKTKPLPALPAKSRSNSFEPQTVVRSLQSRQAAKPPVSKRLRLGINLPKRHREDEAAAARSGGSALTDAAAGQDRTAARRPSLLQLRLVSTGSFAQAHSHHNNNNNQSFWDSGKGNKNLRAKSSSGSLRSFLGLGVPRSEGSSDARRAVSATRRVASVDLRQSAGGAALSSIPPRLRIPVQTSQQSFSTAVMAAMPHSVGTSVHHNDGQSDISSVISLGDRPVLSSSEDEDDERHLHDTQKYRLPDLGKSRGSSRNGFILEDGSAAERIPPTPKSEGDELKRRFSSAEDVGEESAGGYFNPYGLARTSSIYTLSRASFSNQLSQLTAIKLPQAGSLASIISSIPTSAGAARALNDAADQIRIWISKATEVLDGLDAEDDVEWAAAGGRDGLGSVDGAIMRFESLINVYVTAIENLERRPDIENLSGADLTSVVTRMEKILQDWSRIKESLEGVKQQVELAMQWEEMWNSVLGEIGMEEEKLSRLIFEMEEKRHKHNLLDSLAEPGQGLDIKELETIVEGAPGMKSPPMMAKRSATAKTLTEDGKSAAAQEDSTSMALVAKLQPLRAALDFLPMRLSEFFATARDIFPTACEELEARVDVLEAKYKKLENDATALRKELGEDRWVLIFRKAGRQALKMCESVDRSIFKLRESLEEGTAHTNPAALVKKIENYEAKKEHYGPAIQKVLAIIDRGVATRLTANGEVLRLQQDMQRRWGELEAQLKGLDFALEQLNISRGGASLRDSISTILSEQRSVASSTGTLVDTTPGSSPASSVIFLGRYPNGGAAETPRSKSRQGSFASSTATARSMKRYSSLPAPASTLSNKSSASNLRASVSARLYPGAPPRSMSRQDDRGPGQTTPLGKPRWNASTNLNDTVIGHNFRPLSASEESPYRREGDEQQQQQRRTGLRSPRSYAVLGTSTQSAIPSPLGKGAQTPRRPGSSLALRSSTYSSAIPHLSAAPVAQIAKKAIPVTPARNGVPRSTSMYGTPGGAMASTVRASGLRSPPPTTGTMGVNTARRHVSSSSVTSVGSKSSSGSTQGTVRGLTGMMTPQSRAGTGSFTSPYASGAQSPSYRPGSVLGGSVTSTSTAHTAINTAGGQQPTGAGGSSRRLSMLPTPKRISSASNTTASAAAAAAVAMAGGTRIPGTTPQPNRAAAGSRAGSRAGFRENSGKPKWK